MTRDILNLEEHKKAMRRHTPMPRNLNGLIRSGQVQEVCSIQEYKSERTPLKKLQNRLTELGVHAFTHLGHILLLLYVVALPFIVLRWMGEMRTLGEDRRTCVTLALIFTGFYVCWKNIQFGKFIRNYPNYP